MHKKVAPSFIPNDIFTRSLNRHKENNLFLYLNRQFGENEATDAMVRYSIGTSKICPGATVLWRIDCEDKKRSGRVSLFDAETCKEAGRSYYERWVHQLIKAKQYNFIECLFGENLLKKEPGKPVVIVYSEKTAIIASCLYPEYLWLAMANGSKAPDINICRVLSGRTVTWFPSLGFDKLRDFIDML